MKPENLTQARLKELLSFNEATGEFKWIRSNTNCVPAGSRAGSRMSTGYMHIQIDGRFYPSHRLAWLYVHGSFPKKWIDHINGVRDDNRLENLREATPAQNQKNRKLNSNSSSGFKGVSFRKDMNKWMAYTSLAGKRVLFGYFETAEEASQAYQREIHKYHGEFARSQEAA